MHSLFDQPDPDLLATTYGDSAVSDAAAGQSHSQISIITSDDPELQMLRDARQRFQCQSVVQFDFILRLLPMTDDRIDEPLKRVTCITLCSLLATFVQANVRKIDTKSRKAPMPHFAHLCVFALQVWFGDEACKRFGKVNSSFLDIFSFPETMRALVDRVNSSVLITENPEYDHSNETSVWKLPDALFEETWSHLKKVHRENIPYDRLETGWGFLIAVDICMAWKEDRFWTCLFKNMQPIHSNSDKTPARSSRRRPWANVAAVGNSPETAPSGREARRGNVRPYGMKLLLHAADSAMVMLPKLPKQCTELRFGEYAFLFAVCSKIVGQPMCRQCESASETLLKQLMVKPPQPGPENYCDLLWASHATQLLKLDNCNPVSVFLPEIHEEFLSFDFSVIQLPFQGGHDQAKKWEEFLNAVLAVWSLSVVPDIDLKRVLKFVRRWELQLYEAIHKIMEDDLIITMQPPLLIQIVYAVTHLVLLVTDYGQTYTAPGDGRYLNKRYAVFLDEAALRLLDDLKQENVAPSVTEPLMEILLSVRLLQTSMHEAVTAALRDIGESGSVIPGIYCRPEDWCPPEEANVTNADAIIWENLHRSVTCLMGISSWIKDCKRPKKRHHNNSFFDIGKETDKDHDTIKRKRAAAKSKQRNEYLKMRSRRSVTTAVNSGSAQSAIAQEAAQSQTFANHTVSISNISSSNQDENMPGAESALQISDVRGSSSKDSDHVDTNASKVQDLVNSDSMMSSICEPSVRKRRKICSRNQVPLDREITRFYREPFTFLPQEICRLVPDGIVCVPGFAKCELENFDSLLGLAATVDAGTATIGAWNAQEIDEQWDGYDEKQWNPALNSLANTIIDRIVPSLQKLLGPLKLWTSPVDGNNRRSMYVRVKTKGGFTKKHRDVEFWEENFPNHMGSLFRTYTVWILLENSTDSPVLEFLDGKGTDHSVPVIPGDAYIFSSAIVHKSAVVQKGRRVSIDFRIVIDDDRY